MKLEMSTFARPNGDELLISPPFPMNLGSFTSLPSRETPLYISEQAATRVTLKFAITLPPGARAATAIEPFAAEDGGRSAKLSDRSGPGTITFERIVDLPAGRVQPGDYAKFQDFARKVESALRRDIVVNLSGKR
jgi:hypothetical protein